VVFPGLCSGARREFRDPVGRPGPGRENFGGFVGSPAAVRTRRNPRRARAGDNRVGVSAVRSQGRRMSSTRRRASRSWVCAASMSQVQRSAASGVRSWGVVQPIVCLRNRKVCSRSKRRRNICQSRSIFPAVVAVAEYHSHNGFGVPVPGSRSTCSRITVPSMIGSGSWCPAQERCESAWGAADPRNGRVLGRNGWCRWSWRAPGSARTPDR